MKRLLSRSVALLTLLFFAGTALAGNMVLVKNIRMWPAPDHTRVVLDLSGSAAYRLLPGKDRVTLELVNVAAPRVGNFDLSETPIRSIYGGGAGPGQSRLVFELKRAVRVKTFQLAPNQRYGHRLVMDLYYQTGPAMVADEAPAQRAESPLRASRPPVAPAEKPASQRPALNKPAPVAAPAPVDVAERPAETPVKSKKGRTGKGRDIVIAIDAGHGGEDPGAIGPGGLQEKNVTLAIAREIARLVNAEPGFRAELVRSGDYFIPLKQRREIARARKADFFVSVHADSAENNAAKGSSVYALSLKGATSVSARTLADRENEADLVGGVDISDKDGVLAGVLVDLQMTGTLDTSLRTGAMVLTELRKINTLHSRKVEQAGFAVLKSVDIPSLLVETGYISNPLESSKLATSSHQGKLAQAIFGGIRRHFIKSPPPGTALAARLQGQSTLAQGESNTARD